MKKKVGYQNKNCDSMTETSLFRFMTTHCQELVRLETIGQKFDQMILGNNLYKQEVSESFHFSCWEVVDLVTYIHILP